MSLHRRLLARCWRLAAPPLAAALLVAGAASCSNASGTRTAPDNGHISGADIQSMFARVVAKNGGHGGSIFRAATLGGSLVELADGTVGPGGPRIVPGTLFEVASISKTFTATAVLLEMEAGKLGLDDPASRFLDPSVTAGLLVVDGHDYGPELTFRQLLSHTSGLPHHWEDPPFDAQGANAFLEAFNADVNHLWTGQEVLSYVRKLTPIHAPGGAWHYSDANYVLLGLVLEALEGKPLQEVFRALIFERLGMTQTYLSYHERPPAGAFVSHRFEDDLDLDGRTNQSADWASGGLVSSTRDLERFAFALAEGKVYARASTMAAMQSWVPTGQKDVDYGLGLFRVALSGGRGSVWGHDGHGNAFMYVWPDRGVVFTGTLNQTENDWWPLVDQEIKAVAEQKGRRPPRGARGLSPRAGRDGVLKGATTP